MGKKVILEYNGKSQSKAEWARELGLSIGAFDARYKKYFPHDMDALFSPVKLSDYDKLQNFNEKLVSQTSLSRKQKLQEVLADYKLELSEKTKIALELNQDIRELKHSISSLERLIEET